MNPTGMVSYSASSASKGAEAALLHLLDGFVKTVRVQLENTAFC